MNDSKQSEPLSKNMMEERPFSVTSGLRSNGYSDGDIDGSYCIEEMGFELLIKYKGLKKRGLW